MVFLGRCLPELKYAWANFRWTERLCLLSVNSSIEQSIAHVEYVLWMVKQPSHLYKKTTVFNIYITVFIIAWFWRDLHKFLQDIFFFLQELRLWLSLLVRCCIYTCLCLDNEFYPSNVSSLYSSNCGLYWWPPICAL
jgi:hypothetical protein